MKKTVVGLIVLLALSCLFVLTKCVPNNPLGPGNNNNTATNQVVISGFAFSPAAITITKGETLTWKNDDSVAHTATADVVSAFQFTTGTIPSGMVSSPVAFTQVGVFTYHCSIHPTMHGSVTVNTNTGP